MSEWASKFIAAIQQLLFTSVCTSSPMDTQPNEHQFASQQILHRPIAAQAAATENHTSSTHPTDKLIRVRIEGKDGVQHIRFSYNNEVDSYHGLIDTLLDRYLPEKAKPVDASDYAIELRDVNSLEPIDIKNTEDIELAINLAKKQGHLNMSALINLKSDVVLGKAAEVTSNAISESINSDGVSEITPTQGGKRKLETVDIADPTATLVTPTKKPPTKRRNSSKKTAAAGESKVPVRVRIIRSIAEFHAIGKQNPPRKHVALFAGYTCTTTKSFANALSALKTEGIITYPCGKSVSLTEAGLNTIEAREISPPRDNSEVHARIKALLTPKQQQVFDILAAGGRAQLRDEVRLAVGYTCDTTKSWLNALSKMSTLGVIHYPKDATDPKKKLLQLTDMCYPFVDQQALFGSVEEIGSNALRALTSPLGTDVNGETFVAL